MVLCVILRVGEQHDFSVFWVPRRSVVCDKVLEDEGVMGDVLAEDFPLDWVPLDKDLLSLELDSAFQARSSDSFCPNYRSKECMH